MTSKDSATVSIESLVAGDGERLRAIRLRALRDAPDAFAATLEEAEARLPEEWESQLSKLTTFVATFGGRDVGMVRVLRHDHFQDAGCVISMWVAPEARGQGIGAALMDAVEHWARARGLKRLLLDVVETNLPAIALYMREGFVPNGATGRLPAPREHIREIQLVLTL